MAPVPPPTRPQPPTPPQATLVARPPRRALGGAGRGGSAGAAADRLPAGQSGAQPHRGRAAAELALAAAAGRLRRGSEVGDSLQCPAALLARPAAGSGEHDPGGGGGPGGGHAAGHAWWAWPPSATTACCGGWRGSTWRWCATSPCCCSWCSGTSWCSSPCPTAWRRSSCLGWCSPSRGCTSPGSPRAALDGTDAGQRGLAGAAAPVAWSSAPCSPA